MYLEISSLAVDMGSRVCYHTGMCNTTTNGSSPSPCNRCGLQEGDKFLSDEATVIGPNGLCLNCEEAATGYEADEDHALYWDQHAEG